MRRTHLGLSCSGSISGKAREARLFPPYAHARGMKDGERVDERWGSSEKAHPSPMQEV